MRMLGEIGRTVASLKVVRLARAIVAPLPYPGARPTLKRRLNLYLSRVEGTLGRTRLASYPIKLVVEAANVCNLACPACFTGLGETNGRPSMMTLDAYRRLLDELGDYLYELELHNWGEPLLAKHIYTMIEEATARGISTTVSTNFSIPFTAEKAERLVRSGLTVLGVSIDGARQDTYAQYRVKGRLDTVLANCRLVADAKRRLGAATPRMVWEFHVFEHNTGDVEAARTMAADLDMDICVSKAWSTGEEWDPDGQWRFFGDARAARCIFLWHFAVVNSDGGVAPCCGTFYPEDDLGRFAITPEALGSATFREVWNGPGFRAARGLFRSRTGPEALRRTVCFDCPVTVAWERLREHQRAGQPKETFVPGYTQHDMWNYFWGRRPRRERPDAPRPSRTSAA